MESRSREVSCRSSQIYATLLGHWSTAFSKSSGSKFVPAGSTGLMRFSRRLSRRMNFSSRLTPAKRPIVERLSRYRRISVSQGQALRVKDRELGATRALRESYAGHTHFRHPRACAEG